MSKRENLEEMEHSDDVQTVVEQMEPIKADEMTTSKRCLVLGIGKPYDFVPTGQTESVKGCKFYYLGTDCVDKPHYDDENGIIGHIPQKITMAPSFYDSIVERGIQLPCLANITFAVKFETGGTKVRLAGIDFIVDKK